MQHVLLDWDLWHVLSYWLLPLLLFIPNYPQMHIRDKGKVNRKDFKWHASQAVGLDYHLICVESSSITNSRFPILTSPEYFTTQRQMWGDTLQTYKPKKIKKHY